MTEGKLDNIVDLVDSFYTKLIERAEFFPDTALKITLASVPTLIGIVQMEGYSSE